MEGHKNRSDPERFFPKGESSIEGSLKKMTFLLQNTAIRLQVPLKTQVLDLISQTPSGLTVQDISAKLALNTKTCAKVLDEMVYKNPSLKATAHRYGRVFVHKYHLITPVKDEEKEAQESDHELEIDPIIEAEIREIEEKRGEIIKEAISQSLKKEKKHSRQRITQQSYVRALFVMARISKYRVCSSYDITEMIRNELEPNAKWCLDKKTVLRIIWKLRNYSLIKELCFRIRLRKDDEHEVTYLGDHYDRIIADKQHNRSPNVMYKLLACVPDILPNDPLVSECPAIKNPTNRKPFPLSNTSAVAKSSINIKSKLIREVVISQNAAYKRIKNSAFSSDVTENIILMEDVIKGNNIDEGQSIGNTEALSKAYSLSIFAKSLYKIFEARLKNRYNLLFGNFKVPLCYTALKEMLNKNYRQLPEKYELAYKEFGFEVGKREFQEDGEWGSVEMMNMVVLPKKRKHTLDEMSLQLQKLFLMMERKPGIANSELVKKVGKGLDTDVVRMLKCLGDLGFVRIRDGNWEVTYKY